jgi:cytochrome c peroxidase
MITGKWISQTVGGLVVIGLVLAGSGCKQETAPPAAGAAAKKSPAKTEAKPTKSEAKPPAETKKESSAAGAVAKGQAVPLGLTPVPIPADNPMTPEKIELGKMLYFDKRMSKSGTISCATCHDPKMAWTEHTPTSKGIQDQMGNRNSPTVINAAYMPAQFWDGRAKSLEEQALGPIENPIEMGHKMETVIGDLTKLEGYTARFQKVFGTGVTKEGIAKAIAAFERTVLSGNSPYDRFKNGDVSALNDAQKRGMQIFMEKGDCATCHAPPIFSNGRYYNAGVSSDKEKPDPGRKEVTKDDADMGKFRVPHLREVANTAPYFHDGSAKTLEDAVALMAGGGKDNPNLSSVLKAVREAKLTDQDKKDLVEFLKALSGTFPVMEAPKLP